MALAAGPGGTALGLATERAGSAPAREGLEVEVRELETWEEYAACVALQREVWGPEFRGCVPEAILMIGRRLGGVTAGAFDGSGRLLGFVFGLTGPMDGRLVHWSDRLAVRSEVRALGIGRRLKCFQRDLCLERGVELVYWTYDPLVAANAHFNLNRLGARVVDYLCDAYGRDTGSDLHSGLGTDRLLVVWPLRDPEVEAVLAGAPASDPAPFADAPVVNAERDEGGAVAPAYRGLPDAERIRIEVPADVEAVKAADRARAWEWRSATRRAFLQALAEGFRVRMFWRDPETGRAFYGLDRQPERG